MKDKKKNEDMLIPVIIVTMGAVECETQIKRLLADGRVFPVLVLNGCALDRQQLFIDLVGNKGHCIILPENLGGAGGFRAGMQYCLDSDYPDSLPVWLLDDDAEINDNTLSALLEAAEGLEADGVKWGAIGSVMIDSRYRLRISESGAKVNWKTGKLIGLNAGKSIESLSLEELIPCEYCAAASLLTRVGVIRKVGIFADIFIHYDDVDWCLRMRDSGYHIFCAPKSFFYHPVGFLEKPFTWICYYNVANQLWFYRKYHVFVLRAVLGNFCGGVYLHLWGLHKQGNLFFRGLVDGFFDRPRLLRHHLKFEPLRELPEAVKNSTVIFASCNLKNMVYCRKVFKGKVQFFRLSENLITRNLQWIFLYFFCLINFRHSILIDDYFRCMKVLMPLFFRKTFFYHSVLNKGIY